MFRTIVFLAVLFNLAIAQEECESSDTTASGSFAPERICSGDLIFEDDFDTFNFRKWQHENTLGGGENWDFIWYTNNRTNSFVDDGILYIKPTLTADHLGYSELYTNTIDLNGGTPASQCTNAGWYGCVRTGTSTQILNPIKSARMRTVESFFFKYGKIQVQAKMPAGDWLWSVIALLPRYDAYGVSPTSGEIGIVESTGNRDLVLNDKQIGTQLMGSTLHWGPDFFHNSYRKTHWESWSDTGFNNDFHLYEVIWTPNGINFYVDDGHVGGITPPVGGFWEMGGWGNSFFNPWKNENVMAPFDQEFYISLNVGAGGFSFFPDAVVSPNGKPWLNNSLQPATDFWENRNMWLDSWTLAENNDAALQIDYIKIYAL